MHEESIAEGRKERSPASRRRIKGFVDAYGIDMREFEPTDITRYPTFEDFFTRAHKAGSRPICDAANPCRAVVVADSRVVVFNSVNEAKALWVKGKNFSLANLVMNNDVSDDFRHAAIASFRLSPQDYHRYHSPVEGEVKTYQSLPGDYYQVDPVALQSKVDILTRNRRDYVVIETKEFGKVLFAAVGATDVGSVHIHKKYHSAGTKINKGDELGVFEFGGSSIIVAFQHRRIKFDDDLLRLSEQKIQTSVEVGMSLGYATRDLQDQSSF
ncbi:phosphatidylserine decarboxylase proenzyme, partial [Metarhizium majus ARSEF 297]